MEVAGCFKQRPSEKPFSLLANQGTLQVAPEHSYSLPAEAMHSSGHSDAQSSLHWWMPWRKRCFKDEEYPSMQIIQLKRTHQKTSFWKKISEIKAFETLPSCTEFGHDSVHGFVGSGRLVGGVRLARAFRVHSAGREAWLAERTRSFTRSSTVSTVTRPARNLNASAKPREAPVVKMQLVGESLNPFRLVCWNLKLRWHSTMPLHF